jgi:hypothetical protein
LDLEYYLGKLRNVGEVGILKPNANAMAVPFRVLLLANIIFVPPK